MRYITLEDNKIVSIRNGPSIVDGETASDIGELGDILQADGTFVTPPPPPPAPPGPDIPAEIESLKAQDTAINLQVIDLFEQLLVKGVL